MIIIILAIVAWLYYLKQVDAAKKSSLKVKEYETPIKGIKSFSIIILVIAGVYLGMSYFLASYKGYFEYARDLHNYTGFIGSAFESGLNFVESIFGVLDLRVGNNAKFEAFYKVCSTATNGSIVLLILALASTIALFKQLSSEENRLSNQTMFFFLISLTCCALVVKNYAALNASFDSLFFVTYTGPNTEAMIAICVIAYLVWREVSNRMLSLISKAESTNGEVKDPSPVSETIEAEVKE